MRPSRPAVGYRLSMRLAERAAPVAARFNPKLARGIDARRGLAERLGAWGATQRDPRRPLVWMHAPSVGEGLQAKPVLETLRATRPDWQLAYTFFSPSAERLARALPVDVADYLPFDRPRDVTAALDALRPTALVYSKLDVWPELTLAAASRGVRLGLISATVSPTSSRLRWPTRGWGTPAFRALDRIGAISAEDGERLERLGARSGAIELTGDTRYDSVVERAARLDKTRDPLARLAPPGAAPPGFTIVAGSTWPADETVVLGAFADLRAQVPVARLVLAPHEPNPDHLAGISSRAQALGLPRPVRLSQLDPGREAPLVVVDRVGVLADLYGLADVAFVGGGFHRAGLHSVLEPAVFGVPVSFGPAWKMSRDAGLLLERAGAVSLPDDGRRPLHERWLVWHHDTAVRQAAGAAARSVVTDGCGAADRTAALVQALVATD
ncbi:MAG TPA: glycosyltransferase N-terminal domain-containing protein [Gemmatimonadales bacterium]